MKKKIAIITGSRAEWGLLKPLWQKLSLCHEFCVKVVATGSHLDPDGDYSISEIEKDGAKVEARIWVDDSDRKSSKTAEKNCNEDKMFALMAKIMTELPEILRRLKPDLVIILGDRYEIYSVAGVCRLMGIKIAHISGGELTYGAFDDCLRHCISKLSDLHFTASEAYRKRVIQLGEQPDKVYNCGDPGLYKLRQFEFIPKKQLEKELNIDLSRPFAIFTFHPETCNPGKVTTGIKLVLKELKNLGKNFLWVFTASNNDPEGQKINDMITAASKSDPDNFILIRSLGRKRYLSMAALSEFVGGNSSSGLIEIPALKIPVLNFGLRQEGRPHGKGVLDIGYSENEIKNGFKKILSSQFKALAKQSENPYEGETSIDRIVEILLQTDLNQIGRSKRFYDL
ncbi:MAG: hypothetical protein PWR01_3172 [Clostridiales bacterium]|jgi:UDP-hydrolysing UDP-N-acetyl-D-glucosamine 2-epimerase|nr:hypothetical protein [Clostridiales bacterium]MDN5282099.1 hypothetical protein [Candidatus Ozemobacter sp.]